MWRILIYVLPVSRVYVKGEDVALVIEAAPVRAMKRY